MQPRTSKNPNKAKNMSGCWFSHTLYVWLGSSLENKAYLMSGSGLPKWIRQKMQTCYVWLRAEPDIFDVQDLIKPKPDRLCVWCRIAKSAWSSWPLFADFQKCRSKCLTGVEEAQLRRNDGEVKWKERQKESQGYIYICCEVNNWSKFGGFQSQ